MGARSRPRIFQVADEFRAALRQREERAVRVLARAYEEAWQRAGERVALLAKLGADPLQYPQLALFQEQRLYELSLQLREEVDRLLALAGETVHREQFSLAELAQEHAQALVRAAPGSAEVQLVWTHLSTAAVEQMVGQLQPGSPLYDLLQRVGEAAYQQIARELAVGMALGLNPRDVAENMRRGLRMTYGRAERIARTEMLRAYREVTRQSYLANRHVVTGWIWYSALDARTCPACWAMHGTLHTLDETLDDHPNGRCVMVPVTRMSEEIPTGEVRFAQLSPERQRAVLGAGAYDAYRAGHVRLSDFVGQRYDPRWGSMRYALSWRTVSKRLGLGG